jgi:hypothetical protein
MLWSRVAGDLLDLAALGLAFTGKKNCAARLLAATGAVAGATAIDIIAAAGAQAARRGDEVHFQHELALNATPDEAAQFFNDLPDPSEDICLLPTLRHAVRFDPAPGGRGSIMRLDAEVGGSGRSFRRSEERLLADEMQRFKQLLEA